MGLLPGTNLYRDVHFYREAKEIPGIKIVRYEQSLFFLNKEHFRSVLFKNTVNPTTLANARDRRDRKPKQMRTKKALKISVQNKSEKEKDQELETPADFNVEGQQRKLNEKSDVDFHTIILDCSPWSFVDSMGVQALAEVITDYKAVGINVILVNCTGGVLNVFEKTKFYSTADRSNIYVSLHDAVLQSLCQQSFTDSIQIEITENLRVETVERK